MTMILLIYAGISVTFSLGFVAGAWWASRPRTDDIYGNRVVGLRYDGAALNSRMHLPEVVLEKAA